jgi:hypothetical protein
VMLSSRLMSTGDMSVSAAVKTNIAMAGHVR